MGLRVMIFWLFLLFALAPDAGAGQTQEFNVGDVGVLGIFDAEDDVDPGLVPGLDKYPEFAGLFSNGPLQGVFKAYLLKSGDRLILVDSGWGGERQPRGQMLEILRERGVRPEEITDILVTHLDWDHIGGLTRADKAVFPNAALWIARPEYKAWLGGNLPGRPDFAKERARKLAEIYEGKIRLFDFGQELLPGITAVDASGHTPGHTAYEIASGNDRLIIAGDIIHLPQVQLVRPDLNSKYDLDPQKARAAREAILARAVNEKATLAGMHFAPAGRVGERAGGGYVMKEPRH